MRLLLFLLAFCLAISGLLTAPFASSAVPDPPAAARPAAKLDPQRLKQALDRGNIDDAVGQVESGWKAQYEEYWGGQLTTQVRSVQETAQAINRLDRQTQKRSALIYAIPTPTHLELILISASGKPIHKRVLAANRQALTEALQAFRTQIVNPQSNAAAYVPAAQQVHEWLIAPLQSELASRKISTLIFCLGTGLRSAPIAALHDGKQFLIEQYSIGLIPAFNLLDVSRSTFQRAQVLAMGASEFQELEPLPAVPLEVNAIAGRISGSKAFLNRDFTLANLKAARRQYPFAIVHLATHAEFVPGTPEQSYIQFWDSRLRLSQMKTLELDNPTVQLLVLSACRTALGNPQAELGFAGLAVQSGAKAALASLWSVSDAGTFALMTKFYQQLTTAPIKAEALRQAQLALLKNRVELKTALPVRSTGPLPPELVNLETADFSHPYYWAGFTMIGSPW